MIKTSFLLDSFGKGSIPPFPCPHCGSSFDMEKGGLNCCESKQSRVDYDLDGDFEARRGPFTLRLACSRQNCKETLNCVGEFRVCVAEYPDGGQYLTETLTPLFFHPTICIFALPEEFPEQIKKPLMDSFSLFWSNPSASGNSLRIALEALMDHQRIKKRTTGKGSKLQLHARIELFAKKNQNMGENLLTLKWLGNSGSHLEGLEKKDVIEGYSLFQYAIEELFHKRSKTLAALAKKINRRKGPLSIPSR